MSITAACDVCQYRFPTSRDRLGVKKKCKVCGSAFVVAVAPEIDEDGVNPDEPSAFWQVMYRLRQGITAVVILLLLGAMISLLFVDPVQPRLSRSSVPARNYNPVQNQNNVRSPALPSPSVPEVVIPVRPSFTIPDVGIPEFEPPPVAVVPPQGFEPSFAPPTGIPPGGVPQPIPPSTFPNANGFHNDAAARAAEMQQNALDRMRQMQRSQPRVPNIPSGPRFQPGGPRIPTPTPFRPPQPGVP